MCDGSRFEVPKKTHAKTNAASQSLKKNPFSKRLAVAPCLLQKNSVGTEFTIRHRCTGTLRTRASTCSTVAGCSRPTVVWVHLYSTGCRYFYTISGLFPTTWAPDRTRVPTLQQCRSETRWEIASPTAARPSSPF